MYNGITSKGSQYLAKCQAEGLPIKLSKVKIGNGTLQDLENPYSFVDIKSIKQEFEISEKSQVEEQLKIKVQIDNASLEEGYFTKEIGIYADDSGQEILYWYINDGDQSSWLPPASVSPVKFNYIFNIQVTTAETVIVNWTGKELWVDREFLNTELVKKLDKGNVLTTLNNAEKIVAALQGNGGLKFDENLLYLNDEGTKRVGYYYLDRLQNGIFECLEETTEKVNNSAKFKDISNKASSDRLDNLGRKYYTYQSDFVKANNYNWLNLKKSLSRGAYKLIIREIGSEFTPHHNEVDFIIGWDHGSSTAKISLLLNDKNINKIAFKQTSSDYFNIYVSIVAKSLRDSIPRTASICLINIDNNKLETLNLVLETPPEDAKIIDLNA